MSNEQQFILYFDDDVKTYLLNLLKERYLRLDITKGGCSGLYYKIHESASITSTDYEIPIDEQHSIIVDKAIGDGYFNGVSLLLVSSGYGQMLKFENPNARHSCGCGESFDIK
jgi:iron-sulfur cluster assembly protein